jgi:hypothetical protein
MDERLMTPEILLMDMTFLQESLLVTFVISVKFTRVTRGSPHVKDSVVIIGTICP